MGRSNRATLLGWAWPAWSLAALLLGSCAIQRPAPPRPAPRPAPVSPPLARGPGAAAYVAAAASIDLFVVRASDLALIRSGNPRLRALASLLGAEHRGLAAQLSFAGRRLNALPSAQLLPREERRLAWLATQPMFDDAFMRQMRETHQQSLALHAWFAARGASPTLRPVAVNAERVERAHVAALRGR